MARICPQCGARAIDEQSQFCNKCGYPFPDEPQKKTVVVRTMPRMADTPPPPPQYPVSPPVPEPRAPAVPQARSYAQPPRVRAPARRPVQPAPVRSSPSPFKRLIAQDYPKLVYWFGVIAIILVVFAGISTGTTKSATPAGSSAGTTNDTATTPPGDVLAGIPLFWIGVFVFANLFWRTVCEMCAVQFALHGSLTSGTTVQSPAQGSLFEDGMPDLDDFEGGEPVTCPRCGKVVAVSELRTCGHCGVQGCSNCIRMSGLVKKIPTCKECFETK
jgi:hypothetical protein